MKKKILVILFFCFLLPGLKAILSSQERTIHFKHLSIDDGLSQNTVFSMMQDSKGFMWFGTQDGLNKYDGYRFTVYKPDPDSPGNLSSNQIFALCEDQASLIWIGTTGGGVNIFDPRQEKFFTLPVNPDDPGSIQSLFIYSISMDSSGNIWVGTRGGGLSKISRRSGRNLPELPHNIEEFGLTITTYRSNREDENSLGGDFLSDIVEERPGVFWISTTGRGVDRFDTATGKFTHYRNRQDDPASISNDNVLRMFKDRSGLIWLGTANGLNLLDTTTGTFTRYINNPDDPSSISLNTITALWEDRSGVLWVGTLGGGLNRLNKRTGTFTHYRHLPNDPHTISFDQIGSIYEDRSRILWIGTYGQGLDKFDREDKFDFYRLDPNDTNSLNDGFVYSINVDDAGIVWVGTNLGGLNKIDRSSNTYTHYVNVPGDPGSLTNNLVRCIYIDRAGTLWAGTYGGGLNRLDREKGTFTAYRSNPDDPASLSLDQILTIREDSGGAFWIGTDGGGLNKMNREKGTFTHYLNRPDDPNSLGANDPYTIYESPAEPGILWIGTRFNGLDRFDTVHETFTHFRASPDDPSNLSNNQIICINEDRSGTIWIGTYGGGLNKMLNRPGTAGTHPGTRTPGEPITFKHYTEKDGLCNNSVYGILEDPDGNLWLSTNKGISKFDPKRETFKNFTVKDGLQANEYNGGAYHISREGEMFFGGINGVNAFFPFDVKDNPHIPPIVLTSFSIQDKEQRIGSEHGSALQRSITWCDKLNLTYQQNNISFEFAALDFTIPEKNRYAYQLVGFNLEWVYTGADKRFAYFTNLEPGHYVFRVKGSNNDGVWNETGVSLEIHITPPFWGTWWFRLLAILSAAALGVLWYRRRLTNVRVLAELRTAHDAQMSIMPQEDPQVRGFDISGVCVPANEVGGDFFDYAWMNEEKTRFGIAIGDVSGKAMKSAMTAVMTSGLIYLEAGESQSPSEIMRRINRLLYFKTERNMFTALCLAVFDIDQRRMTFVNAGLNEPILKSGGRIKRLKGNGNKLPLGVRQHNSYPEKTQALAAGDLVLLYTDGITEARDPQINYYGYERLKGLVERLDHATLPAQVIKEKIIEDVKTFSLGAPQHDDIAVVVIKVL